MLFSSSCIQRRCVLNFKLQLSFLGTALTNFNLFLSNRNSFAHIFKLNQLSFVFCIQWKWLKSFRYTKHEIQFQTRCYHLKFLKSNNLSIYFLLNTQSRFNNHLTTTTNLISRSYLCYPSTFKLINDSVTNKSIRKQKKNFSFIISK